MRVECEICGAYTEDPNEIEWAKKCRTCPECRHIGSLFIAEENESMREFNIDLVIDKTFNVFAETVEEAKELAIQRARQLMGTYNSLSIDFVEEIKEEDLEFENEYEVLCFNTDGILVHEYSIEADHTLGAATAAEEFFADDFSNERLGTVRVFPVGVEDEVYDEYVFGGVEKA